MTQAPQAALAPIPLAGWVRIALRCPAIALLLATCVPLHLLCRPFTQHNPAARLFLSGASRILGLRITVKGRRVRKGAFLLANHVSWMDIAALGSASGTAFVAHDGLAGHGLLRWLCELNDTVFVARHDRASVAAQVEQVRHAIRDTGALTIFPEGTTGDGLALLPFKSSLLSAITPVPTGISVQPVWLDYGAHSPAIAWAGDESGWDNFLRIAARSKAITLTIHFLAPLVGDDLANRKTISAAARDAIQRTAAEARATRDQRVAL